jgi:hypothetical protein
MAEKMQRLHNSAYVIFRELCTGEVRRNPLPRTRVNRGWLVACAGMQYSVTS